MVRVIELGHIVAGPCAGLILSDLGFEVIKVEKPGAGDISRRLSKQSSGTFPFYNRNKKSLSLDLNAQRGREIFSKLLATSDIIIDNLGPGAVQRVGFSYEKVKEFNPKIIYLSLKGYGHGVYENRKSLDYPIEVHSGLAFMTGLKGRPMRVGASIIDMSAAMFGVIGILNAMLERERTGNGKYLDIGMFETAAFFMGQHVATYQVEGKDMQPINETGFAWGVYDFFKTVDDVEIFIAVTTDPQWRKFCDALSLGLCDNADFETNEKRYDARDNLIPLIRKKISSMKSEDVSKLLDDVNVSYAFLNTPAGLLKDPHASKKMVAENYNGKRIHVPETPISSVMQSGPPSLGENTEEILLGLGYNESDIKELRLEGTI